MEVNLLRTKFIAVLVISIILLFSLCLTTLATAVPVVTDISPNKGLDSQIVQVTIEGDKFHPKTIHVKLSKEGEPDIEAIDLVYVSKQKITCSFDLRDKAVGQWDLIVSNTGVYTKREKVNISYNAFTIEPTAPIITSVEPQQAFNNSTVTLLIKGGNFQIGAQVTLVSDNTVLHPINTMVVSAEEIQAKIALNGTTPGDYDIQVANPDGRKGTLAKGFAIKQGPLALYGIEPNSATNNGSVTVTLWGFSFDKDMNIRLKQNNTVINAANSEIISTSEAKVNFDLAGANPGIYDVEVNNRKGETAKLPGAFGIVKANETQVITPVPESAEIDLNSQLGSIFFDFDKYDIRADQYETLKQNLKVLEKRNPNSYIVLGGHADERGPNNYNINLSAKRAESVKKYLVSNGFDSSKIIIYAYGEDYPAKEGHDEESWSYNRRVDISIWETLPTKNDALKK